jgi:sterol desaturase/sphingolipid hydroxylase (fatty acid hydroxylase superfamily)
MITRIAIFASWIAGSCISAELFGYVLHRLLHSGLIGFLSRNHMSHHLVMYAPAQAQRSAEYKDAETAGPSIGNIGLEWLGPAAALVAALIAMFSWFHVPLIFQLTYFVVMLTWSFLMFNYLHDMMHVENFWLAGNRWLKSWFTVARDLHDIHHVAIDDEGRMDKNFGIGFFFFDRLFGTLLAGNVVFNHRGYQAAIRRFQSAYAPGRLNEGWRRGAQD